MSDITTPAKAERAAFQYLADQAEAEQIQEAIKEAQARAAAELTPQLVRLQTRIAATKAELEAWIAPQLDAKTRSLVIGSARIGMKSGPPAVALAEGTDDKAVIASLKEFIDKANKAGASAIAKVRAQIATACLKVKTELDKAAIKKALSNESDSTGPDMLADCGLSLKTSETLTVTQA